MAVKLYYADCRASLLNQRLITVHRIGWRQKRLSKKANCMYYMFWILTEADLLFTCEYGILGLPKLEIWAELQCHYLSYVLHIKPPKYIPVSYDMFIIWAFIDFNHFYMFLLFIYVLDCIFAVLKRKEQISWSRFLMLNHPALCKIQSNWIKLNWGFIVTF